MGRTFAFVIAAGLSILGLLNCGDSGDSVQERLHDATRTVRAKHGLPGMGALIRSADGSYAVAVDGRRRADRPDPLQAGDRFHIGSNAKAMTATMIATLVEEGHLDWDTKILDVFPEMAASADPAYANATLRQLLCHLSGLAAFTEYEDMVALPSFPGSPSDQRTAVTAYLLARPPAVVPGTFLYSNVGYVVAAAIAERIAGQSWEALMDSRLFDPLDIAWNTNWPGSDGSAQPWGHWDPDQSGGPLVPYDPVNGIAFPALFAPGGDVSMSLADYGRFLDLHLTGLAGEDGLLRAATVHEMHTPPAGQSYTMGWNTFDMGGQRVEDHMGGGVQFLAYVFLLPAQGRAIVVVANSCDARTERAIDDLATAALAIH